jgi:multidrug efflux pump
VVQPRLAALEGVQRAGILGARTFAMRAWLKPNRMAALNISPSQVRAALADNNYLAALGQTKGALVQVNLTANTDLNSVEEFENLVVREQDGTLIRLKDIADVELGAESYEDEVRFSGDTAVFMGIWPLPTANSLDVMDRVHAEMDSIKENLPSGMEAQVGYDATEYINNAITEVITTLSETLLLVIIIIFLVLGSLRSVFIPIVSIPMSLIGAVFLMQVFGFTVNLLTLLAIVLSVGLVVDDAIVVVENVERHLRKGETPVRAAIRGARELVGPIIAMTVTLAAVYAPIGFQGGLTGSLFREFAFTLAGAVFISGIVALTLSPMLSAKLLKPGIEEHGMAARSARVFERIRAVYTRLLDATLNARPAVYIVWIGISLLAIPMFIFSPTELAPSEDQGVIFAIIDGDANAALDQTRVYTKAVDDAYMSVPETDFTFQITNPTGGFAGMVVKPWDQRDRTIFEILPEVRQKLQNIPAVDITAITPPALPGGGGMPVEFVLTSTADTERILEFAQQIKSKAADSGLFAFPPQLDVKVDKAQAKLEIDHDKVADLGLDLRRVGADVSAMMSGAYVNRFNIDGRSYKVIPQIKRADRLNPEQLLDIHISGPDNSLIPLSTVAQIERDTVPRSLNRFNQQNSVKISGVPVRPLDEALGFLEDEARQILPEGYTFNYTGESRQLRVEGGRFLVSFVLALALIFLVLAAQFNSFRDPFVILAGSVPLAMFGALIFTVLKMPNPNLSSFTDGWTTTLNIYSQVGLVTLVGLVSKNGILIVEFAKQQQLRGLAKLDAVREAARTRLRPVLMTSGATIGGHFPLVLVSGAGAEARNSIGLIIVGGMAIGTLFTLFVVPSIYMLIGRDHAGSDYEQEAAAERDYNGTPEEPA